MRDRARVMWLVLGLLLGGAGAGVYCTQMPIAYGGNDRYEDFILCTGAVAVNANSPTDGVWLLDYKAGKLLGTLIDRANGKIVGWAEVDLVSEFNLPPRHNVHFMMTTGMIAKGQAALYVAETTSKKFAVYTMGVRPDGKQGVTIKRHDLVMFNNVGPKT